MTKIHLQSQYADQQALDEPTNTKTDREILIDYLMMKARQEDWHGVSDAANDLREMDASGKGVDKSAVSRWVEKALKGKKK